MISIDTVFSEQKTMAEKKTHYNFKSLTRSLRLIPTNN